MTQKRIKQLSFTQLRQVLAQSQNATNDFFYLSADIGMLRGTPPDFIPLMLKHTPLRFNEPRFAMIRKGYVHYSINLREGIVEAGNIFYLGSGSIIELIDFPPDVEIIGCAFSDFYLQLAFNKQLPAPFNGKVRDLILKVNQAEADVFYRILDALWKVLHLPYEHQESTGALVKAVVHYFADLSKAVQGNAPANVNNEQDIFNRYIQLVNAHCRTEHQLPFYAEKLCISPHYLGTVVKQASDVTAKEWIDRALISEAKVLLKHSPMRVSQIAYELNFPNPSFFNKFFKRITGQTPETYRES